MHHEIKRRAKQRTTKMNSRQAKKKRKKDEWFVVSFVNNYNALRKERRYEHEYFHKMRRKGNGETDCWV